MKYRPGGLDTGFVLVKRQCAYSGCEVEFTSHAKNDIYHSLECARLAKNAHARRRAAAKRMRGLHGSRDEARLNAVRVHTNAD